MPNLLRDGPRQPSRQTLRPVRAHDNRLAIQLAGHAGNGFRAPTHPHQTVEGHAGFGQALPVGDQFLLAHLFVQPT